MGVERGVVRMGVEGGVGELVFGMGDSGVGACGRMVYVSEFRG